MSALCRDAGRRACSRSATRRAGRCFRPAARACWPTRRAHYAVADGKGDYGFCYLNMRMGRGPQRRREARASATRCWPWRRRTSRRSSSREHVGVTLQIDESPGQVYDAKHSNLHPLFNKTRLTHARHRHTIRRNSPPNCTTREKSRVQVEHFSKRFPEHDHRGRLRDLARLGRRSKIAEGRSVKGHKIGLTSRAMQQASQIDEPDYGTLLDDMFFEPAATSRPSASSRRASRWSWPSSSASRCKAPSVDAVRRAGGHRLRDAGHRDHRRAHRAVRPPHQGDAQGASTPSATTPPTPASCSAAGRCSRREVDLRWVGALLLQERRRSRKPAWPPAC